MQATTAPSSSSVSLSEGIRGAYQRPDAKMTLREGLAEYYRVNPGLSEPDHIESETSANYFRNHDTTHVVFGTHTGLMDESVNDMLTILGVEISFWDYGMGFFATDESKAISKTFVKMDVFVVLWRTLKLWPTIRRHSKAMTKKWPWNPPAELLDRSLDEIRQEYGIKPFRPEVALGLMEAS